MSNEEKFGKETLKAINPSGFDFNKSEKINIPGLGDVEIIGTIGALTSLRGGETSQEKHKPAPSEVKQLSLGSVPLDNLPATAGILTDIQINELCKKENKPMISPFVSRQIRERGGNLTSPPADFNPDDHPFEMISFRTPIEKIISYGLSSHGYDVRLANKFKIFTNVNSAIIDPLNMSEDCYHEHEGDYCIIPPNSYILGYTEETFVIPRDIMVVCVGKSTYARVGAIVNVTPIEAGFEGQVVIEISNATPLPLKVYAGMGIAQFLFFRSSEECGVSYVDRKGKYQGQTGLTTARI